jgi:hypothetical protein
VRRRRRGRLRSWWCRWRLLRRRASWWSCNLILSWGKNNESWRCGTTTTTSCWDEETNFYLPLGLISMLWVLWLSLAATRERCWCMPEGWCFYGFRNDHDGGKGWRVLARAFESCPGCDVVWCGRCCRIVMIGGACSAHAKQTKRKFMQRHTDVSRETHITQHPLSTSCPPHSGYRSTHTWLSNT